MQCKVCGAESGKYPLCRTCYYKKERGEIIKCGICNSWHYRNTPCHVPTPILNDSNYLYDVKPALISKSEQNFYNVIRSAVPEGYCVFPQINLAAFIKRTDNARFQNELFRNVDFLITDATYSPKLIIEINDQTHLSIDRKERDEKVQKICEEAGIPIVKLWTSYGTNAEYIKKRIDETLMKMPVARIHHFNQVQPNIATQTVASAVSSEKAKKQGCYIATCVYGSYNCPPVWALRRYRDNTLAKTWRGRLFIRCYYATSPILVKLFGEMECFKSMWRRILNIIVAKLQASGVESTPYCDND